MLIEYQAHGILQTRIPEWVAIPSPGDSPDSGIEPGSPALLADSLLSEPQGSLIICIFAYYLMTIALVSSKQFINILNVYYRREVQFPKEASFCIKL